MGNAEDFFLLFLWTLMLYTVYTYGMHQAVSLIYICRHKFLFYITC